MSRSTVQNSLEAVRMRPRFEARVACEPTQVLEALRVLSGVAPSGEANVPSDRRPTADAAPQPEVVADVFAHSAVLRIPRSRQQFWSPQLQVGVETQPEGGTVIRGLFGPRPAVWTMFAALYGAVAFLGAMAAVIGLSLWSLGRSAGLLVWSIPVTAVLIAGIYAAAAAGRRLGRAEMQLLRARFDAAISSIAAGPDPTPPVHDG